MIVKALFWASLGGLAWTHVGYPLAAAGLRRLRERQVAKDDITLPEGMTSDRSLRRQAEAAPSTF